MDAMNRREFGKLAGASALGLAAMSSGFVLTGCNWVQDVENWTQTGEESIASIESILTANNVPIPQGPLNIVNAAFAAIHEACAAYLATTPPPVGALQKIQTALQDCSAAIGSFITALGLPGGNLLSLIVSLGELLLSTIAGFANQATAASKSAVVGLTMRVGAASYSITPKVRSRRGFKKDWNGTLHGAHGVSVPKAAEMHVSLFEHF